MSSSSAYTTEFRNNRPRLLVCKTTGDIYDARHAIVLSILMIAGLPARGSASLIWFDLLSQKAKPVATIKNVLHTIFKYAISTSSHFVNWKPPV